MTALMEQSKARCPENRRLLVDSRYLIARGRRAALSLIVLFDRFNRPPG
jgi:hypothetical protein